MITKKVKKQAFAALGCDPDQAELLGGYNGNVFGINRGGEEIVVKILENAVINVEALLSELEWLEYLRSKGLSAVKPLRLEAGKFIHPVSEEYCCVAYEKAPGIPLNPNDIMSWNPNVFEQWGKVMGKMHALAKSYDPVHIRPQWFQHNLLQDEFLHKDPLIAEKWRQYRAAFKQLSVTRDEYGLIHGDLHHSNVLLHQGNLTLLDFGDSEYHWYAYDIAISVYHTAYTVPAGPQRDAFLQVFFNSFMNGYAQENSNIGFISQIDAFIDYRHLFSYTYHTAYADLSQLKQGQLEFLGQMRSAILNGSCCLGFALV
ncbi:phosphotransferase enzyme family protein [Paenibacillus sp. 22594]|uniref:phosphotransferase enzyme family protein n=1 Tax=Paenibacillus sp. 22594 TaxID=3453947 RepID=UPI003F83586A